MRIASIIMWCSGIYVLLGYVVPWIWEKRKMGWLWALIPLLVELIKWLVNRSQTMAAHRRPLTERQKRGLGVVRRHVRELHELFSTVGSDIPEATDVENSELLAVLEE